jgi:Putative Ig domain/Abnormal spindle-like microcephaly-assoc'd, ASPM-SPD-2-Hydin
MKRAPLRLVGIATVTALAVSLTLAVPVAGASAASARPLSHGGSGGSGGGGGNPTPPPPASGPTASVSPSTLTFPAEDTGVSSAPQTVTLTNNGPGSLFINSVSDTGSGALDFTRTGDNCDGATIPAGGNCTITVVFTPAADGTLTDTMTIVDNASDSPQTFAVTGIGSGTGSGPTPLGIFTGGLPCPGGVCDITEGAGVVANNFEATFFSATGGTAPYSWSAADVPTGLIFAPSSLLSGSLPTVGTFGFSVTVTDAVGASATQRFSITVDPMPSAGPSGCQQGPGVREALSGPAIGGKTPGGQAAEDESHLTACGGYGTLTATADNVNLPNGTVLWVYLDDDPVGVITLNGGAGSMKPFILRFGLSFDQITVVAGPPPATLTATTVLSGGSFS